MATTKLTAKDGMAFELEGYIRAGIAKEAAKIADTYKEQIVKDVEEAMSDIVARLSTRLVKYYTVHNMSDHIEIHVRKEL